LSAARQVLRAEQTTERLTRLVGSRFADARGVGAHVRDQTHRALFPDIDSLVESLRHAHGLLGAEAQLLGCLLLQRARGERRRRILPPLPTLDLCDGEGVPSL